MDFWLHTPPAQSGHLTPKLRRGPHSTAPGRPQNVRCGPSPPAPCWGAEDRRGRPGFPGTDHRHPRGHRPGHRRPPCPGDRGRWGLTRRHAQGGSTRRPRARPDRPASRGPPGLAWRGGDTALTAALTTTAGHRRTPQGTTGRADPTTGQATARPDHAETVSPVTGTRHRCWGLGPPRRPLQRARDHRAARGAHDRRLGPCWTPGLGRAGVEAMIQGTQGVWHGTIVPGRLVLWATPDNNAARSSPTPALTCCRKRERSGRWRQSGAVLC